MTPQPSAADRAERYSRKRTRAYLAIAVLLLGQQVVFAGQSPAWRTVDLVRAGAWVVMAAVVLAGLMTGGAWLRPKAVRALMEDEVTRANRASALATGFLAAVAAGIVQYVVLIFIDLPARLVIHVIVTAALASALICFAVLERRALA